MKKYRTPKKDRATYIYTSVTGTRVTLRPDENGVTQADIAVQHRFDDDEWNNDYAQTRTGRKYAPNGRVSLDDIDENGSWVSDDSADPEKSFITKEEESETKRIVRDAIAQLPDKQAEAITAVWLEGVSAREYAKTAGTTEANVSALLRRAFDNLRKIIKR